MRHRLVGPRRLSVLLFTDNLVSAASVSARVVAAPAAAASEVVYYFRRGISRRLCTLLYLPPFLWWFRGINHEREDEDLRSSLGDRPIPAAQAPRTYFSCQRWR